ncbi:hypothetical protein [Agrobacterium tumefaciens]|uniref:hypothetical protein n=1 Tax=Agrobacterium tumefaciens TaxID=358 RepID=UPI001573E29D|nr:hypothetical protein [Agrobacterium tumefaciens]
MNSYDIYVQISHLESLAEDARFSGFDDAAALIDRATSMMKEAEDIVEAAEQKRENEAIEDEAA